MASAATAAAGANLNIWTSVWQLTTFQEYVAYNLNPFLVNGQLPANDWNCSFGNPNWLNCLIYSWVYPLIFSMWFIFLAFFVQTTQHWGFYASLGAPEIENSFVSGVHNVYTAWYVVDAEISTLYTFIEVFLNSFFILFFAGNIFGWNARTLEALEAQYPQFAWLQQWQAWESLAYIGLGVLMLLSIFIYQANMTYIFAYNVINAVYLQSRYQQDTWVTIQFGTLWNFYNTDDMWLAPLVYLEQLFIGNKRLALYNNFMMAIMLIWHPITLPWSLYFWMQLPYQLVLDVIVYPIFPALDTPQIPWHEYFN